MTADGLEFFSEEWIAEYVKKLNASPKYKEAGRTWEGDLIFEVSPDGTTIIEPLRVYMDLWHGHCREARTASLDDNAEFTYSGSLANWKKLLSGQIGPIRGIMSRKFRLHGSMTKITKYIKAAQVKVEVASSIPTKFQDEIS
ncbi:MAG: SCP2 sterol-binding domain-containing protein [Candidatus Thorarchaeota archaeon]|nr:MAG: sterol carrier protein [Candidatus Thorarchaeota archaeon]